LEIFNSADDVLKNIIVGNVIPAVILGILSGFLYFFLGYPYVILLAIIRWSGYVHTHNESLDRL
jgi:predicted PurR-regulated permease PerM